MCPFGIIPCAVEWWRGPRMQVCADLGIPTAGWFCQRSVEHGTCDDLVGAEVGWRKLELLTALLKSRHVVEISGCQLCPGVPLAIGFGIDSED